LSGLSAQSAADHAAHHRNDKNSSYCVVTPFANMVLDGIGAWRGLEGLMTPLFATPRREDLQPNQTFHATPRKTPRVKVGVRRRERRF
jgi:hypothetical protein